MRTPWLGLVVVGAAAMCGAALAADATEQARQQAVTISTRVSQLTRTSTWRLIETIPVAFPTHHPQGMVKIGDTFFLSSVEVTTPTERFGQTTAEGYDRSPGAGIGHLFKIDGKGQLVGEVKLGEGSIYHPGGIDFDGHDLWVPVAEYRPDSRAILYRVDPTTMKATEVHRVADHIGGLVLNSDDHTLHGVSWGSRRLYRWALGADGRVTNGKASLADVRVANPSHYVDYQDCKYVGRRQMLCTGVVDLRQSAEAPVFRLGGLELVSLTDGRPVHQTPLLLWTTSGRPMAQNPSWFETTASGLRAYFVPEDDASTIYVYETSTPRAFDQGGTPH